MKGVKHMKKLISIISSVAMTATMAAAFSANAADAEFSEPTFYFKIEETKGVETLLSGLVYVNQKEATSVPASIYIKDEDKVAGQVFVKWASDNKDVNIKNVTGPVAKYGATPYKNFANDEEVSIVELPAINGAGLNYSDTSSAEAMEYTGETSDAYPLACFDVVLANGAENGKYNISVYDVGLYVTSVVCRPTGDGKFKEVFPAEKSEKLVTNVGDRMLGDMNDDKRVDAADASSVLKAYAKISSNIDPEITAGQTACADVNGDSKVDSVDASKILSYYAYASTVDGEPVSLNNFIKGKK